MPVELKGPYVDHSAQDTYYLTRNVTKNLENKQCTKPIFKWDTHFVEQRFWEKTPKKIFF